MKYILIFLFLVQSSIYAQKISESFDVTVSGNNIDIVSRSMNYHFASFISKNGDKSSPSLVERNENKIELQSLGEIKWVGITPIFVFNDIDSYTDVIRKSTEKTTIVNPTTDWKNSSLQIISGNIPSIINEGPKAEVLGLFLLNLTAIPKMIADSSLSGKIDISNKVDESIELINGLKKIQDFSEKANTYVSYLDIFINVVNDISNALDENNIADKPVFLTDSYNYLNYVTTLSKQILQSTNTLNPQQDTKDELSSVFVKTFKKELNDEKEEDTQLKELTKNLDDTSSSLLSLVLKEIPKKFKNSDDREELFYKIGNIAVSAMGKVLTKYQENKLIGLDEKSAEYKKIALSITKARLAIGVAVLSTSIFTSDIKDSKKYAGKYLLALASDASKILGSHLLENEKILSSNSLDPSASKFGTAVKQITKGVSIGNTVANQLVPFLYDLVFGESKASVDISNGELLTFGDLETKIIITNDDGDTIYNSSSNTELTPTLYVNQNNTLTIKVYAKQDSLFDNDERSLWEVHTELPPTEMYNAIINYGSKKSFLKMCMIKTYFSSYIDFYSNSGGISLGRTLFSKIHKSNTTDTFGWSCSDKKSFIDNTVKNYDLDDLKTTLLKKFKVKNHDEPILTQIIQVTDFNDKAIISLDSYQGSYFKAIEFKSNNDRLFYSGEFSQVEFDNHGIITLDFNKNISLASLSNIKIFDNYDPRTPILLTDSDYYLSVKDKSLIITFLNPQIYHDYILKIGTDVLADDGSIVTENIELDLRYKDELSLQVLNSEECKQTGTCQFRVEYSKNLAERLFTLDFGDSDSEIDYLDSFTESETTKYKEFTHTFNSSDSYNIRFLTYADPSDTKSDFLEEIPLVIDNISSNTPPTAKAGADQTVNFNQAVTLTGNESNDSDGNIVSYEWTENGSTLSNDVNFTKNDFSIGTHTITLIVTDNDGATGSDDVVITVLENNTTGTITHNGFTYNEVVSPHTGRVWLDRNLGANRVCTSLDDSECYGDYYQWGRGTDGHEKKDSSTSDILVTSISNTNNNFIISNPDYWDWLLNDDNGQIRTDNWLVSDGNSICPINYRVPTMDELRKETIDSSDNNNFQDVGFASFLKLANSGYRHDDGYVYYDHNMIWSSSTSYNDYNVYTFGVSYHNPDYTKAYGEMSTGRIIGHPVRCIKDNKYIREYTKNIVYDKSTKLYWQDNYEILFNSFNWYEAKNYCENLNLGNFSDWRVPSSKELITLAEENYQKYFKYFSNSYYGYLWTSDTYNRSYESSNSTNSLNIQSGNGSGRYKTDHNRGVRCTRGNFSINLTHDTEKNIVYDNSNNLLWQDGVLNPILVTMTEAKNYCSTLNLNGISNWRIPTISELVSISDVYNGIEEVFNNKGKLSIYITNNYISSSYLSNGKNYWYIDLGSFNLSNTSSVETKANIRCVKDKSNL